MGQVDPNHARKNKYILPNNIQINKIDFNLSLTILQCKKHQSN